MRPSNLRAVLFSMVVGGAGCLGAGGQSTDPGVDVAREALVTPATGTFTLRAGDPVLGVATEHKTVDLPAKPPKADIEIAIDTTGSMTASINQAKTDATN